MGHSDDTYDQWLVIRCQEGDAAALAELVDRWAPRLRRHARRLVDDRAAADDVSQAAWLAIVRGIGRLEDPACFRRWAYRIVTNKSADWVRDRQRQRVRAEPLGSEPVDQHDNPPMTRDDIAVLREALRRLPGEQQAIVSMFYLDGLSLREVAHSLSLPLGTVKSRLHYARLALKSAVERSQS